MNNFNLIVITGPTATGKTGFAAALAHRIGSEIISADSRQVYKRMDLGTGKDYDDYLVHGQKVPCHLIDIVEPGTKYNVYEFQKDFTKVFKDISQRGKIPVLCGGTGMYIEAVTKNYKLVAVPVNEKLRKELNDKSLIELEKILANYKRLHNRSDTDTKKRAIRAIEIEEYYSENPEKESFLPEINPLIIGVQVDRETRRERITLRLEQRLKEGMIEEVQSLIDEGISPEDLIYYGLEYKFITLFLQGTISKDEMQKQLNTAIHQFAKRQMTWFRKMERQGTRIHWIDGLLPLHKKIEKALAMINPTKQSLIPAERSQLNEIMELYNAAIQKMNENKIFQWDERYPTIDILEKDIHTGSLFTLIENGEIAGCISLDEEYDIEYDEILWKYPNDKFLVVHRLCIHPDWQRKGLARKIMNYAEKLAWNNGYTTIRLDTFSENPYSIGLFESMDYEYRGKVFFKDWGEFLCYEKLICC